MTLIGWSTATVEGSRQREIEGYRERLKVLVQERDAARLDKEKAGRAVQEKIEEQAAHLVAREQQLDASHLLVAAGRKMNVEGLGLDAAGVQIEKGRIVSDATLRTSNKNIYVCGDVAGSFQFTHMAEHHAGVVLRNILNPLPFKFAKTETRVIPWCTFTEPELARVGVSEAEAKQQNIPHRVYKFPFEEMDRARAEGDTEGFAKIITDPKGVILGAAIAGAHAGELIHEYVLAMAKRMTANDLSGIIHIYPTLAQINRRVADQRRKESLTPTAKKWLMRIAGLRGV